MNIKYLDITGLESYDVRLKNYINDTMSISSDYINDACTRLLVDVSYGSGSGISLALLEETKNIDIE